MTPVFKGMTNPNKRTRPVRPPQTGAITLLVAITLGLLASLASFYSTRSVLFDQLASQNQTRATQSRWAAEGALGWARATLQQAYHHSPSSDLWLTADPAPCPAGYVGPRWQCVALPFQPHPQGPAAQIQVLAVRDLIASPHVAELHASVRLNDQHSHSQVQASVFVPSLAPAPSQPNLAALVVNGCAAPAPGAQVRVCPRNPTNKACSADATGPAVHSLALDDPDGNGVVSSSERSQCLAFEPSHLPAGGALLTPDTDQPRSSCVAHAWRQVLGEITPAQIQVWSLAQERNGLHAQSQPRRNVYWVDSPAPWAQSLGDADAPVLLVFSAQACRLRCPSIAAGVRIVGTVVLQSQCQDDKARGWRAGHIEGQVVVESGLPELQSGSHIQARTFAANAYQLPWPKGMDARRVQRVPGSWREGVR